MKWCLFKRTLKTREINILTLDSLFTIKAKKKIKVNKTALRKFRNNLYKKSSVPVPYDAGRGNYSIFAFVLIPVSFLQSSVNLDAPC